MKSIYLRNFTVTTILLAACMLMLSVSFIGIGRTYLIEDYRRDMLDSATEVAHTAAAVSRMTSLSDWVLGMAISSISGSTGNHIFITDPDGVIVNCSDKLPHCRHIGQRVPEEVLEETDLLLRHANVSRPCVFRSNHASNYLSLRGTLPQDKEAMLKMIHRAMKDHGMLKDERFRAL